MADVVVFVVDVLHARAAIEMQRAVLVAAAVVAVMRMVMAVARGRRRLVSSRECMRSGSRELSEEAGHF